MTEQNQPMDEGAALMEAYQTALQRDDIQAAQAAAMQFMAFACERSENEPSADLLLKMEAHEHETAGDWQKAEAAYRKALALAQAENNAALISNAHADLRGLYAFLGQKDRALEEATAATGAARRADIPPLLTMALENEARCWLHLGELPAALKAANEIFGVLDDDNSKLSDTQRARAQVLRARCLVEMHDTTAARADLDRAWPWLQKMSGAVMFAGVQSALAEWWEVIASLRTLDSDFTGAADALRKAVEFRRHISQLPQLEGPYKFASLANTLHKLGQALPAAQDIGGAEEAFRETREIRRRIGQPSPDNTPHV